VSLLRLHFFSAFFGLGAVWPLLGLAFAARGLSPSEYAWLFALWPLSRLLASPFWGALADRRFGNTQLLRINGWLSALAIVALASLEGRLSTAISFALWAFFSSSLTPLAEASAYAVLAERAANFGYVRVFGSIGFALSALAVSFLALDPDGAAPFAVAALGYVTAALVAQRLPLSPARERTPHEALARLPLRADMLLFWLASTLYGAAHGLFDVYFGPFVRALPGVPTQVVGSAWGVGVLCEVVVVWFMPRMLAGRASALVLPGSALIATLRWWLLARATSAYELLLLAPLHGVTFGAWYLAFVHENQRTTEPHLRATMQGVAAASLGLGVISATVVGGFALEHWGGRRLFEIAALLALSSLALYLLRFPLSSPAPLSRGAVSGQD
jgi:MFS family permease